MIGPFSQKRGKKGLPAATAGSVREEPATWRRRTRTCRGRDAVGPRVPRPAPRAAARMPRSFLVKKHFNASKKPNYSELDTHTGKGGGPMSASPSIYK